MNRVSVGVIGTGHLGRYHALNYGQIPEANLVGIYDQNVDKAKEVAAEANCQVFNSIESLLDEVQAVSVAVPTDHHFKVVQSVLKSGTHCIVEKPMTTTVDEADQLIDIATQKRLILHVGHIERFNPALQGLKDVQLAPQFIESHRLAPFNPRGTEVAVILDLMIHDIDIVLHLINSPVASVDASGVAVVSDSIDIANARIRFENNAVANLTASRISQKKMRKMRLFQKDTYIGIDFDTKQSEIYALEGSGLPTDMVLSEIGVGDKKRKIIYHKPDTEDGNALRSELEAFIQNVNGNSIQAVTGREGREALYVAQAVLDCMNA